MNAPIQKFRRTLARIRLRRADFSIISNNCWGGHVYQILGRQFSTPFIGLFISPRSYLRLLGKFPQCLSFPHKFKAISDERGLIWCVRLMQPSGRLVVWQTELKYNSCLTNRKWKLVRNGRDGWHGWHRSR